MFRLDFYLLFYLKQNCVTFFFMLRRVLLGLVVVVVLDLLELLEAYGCVFFGVI